LARQKFSPDTDYVALTGPTILVSLLYGAALAMYRRVRILAFDAREGVYLKRLIHADQRATV
jgi:hypothetical protein